MYSELSGNSISKIGKPVILPKLQPLFNFIRDINKLAMCPITYAHYINPVCSIEGQVYEKDDILNWIRNHGSTDPQTRNRLIALDLNEIYSMKWRLRLMKDYDINQDFVSKLNNNLFIDGNENQGNIEVKSGPPSVS